MYAIAGENCRATATPLAGQVPLAAVTVRPLGCMLQLE